MYQPTFQPQFQPSRRGAAALGVAAALGMGATARARSSGRMSAWVAAPVRPTPPVPLTHDVPMLPQALLAERVVPSAQALDALSPDERARLLGEW
jgi:hypothetical protein